MVNLNSRSLPLVLYKKGHRSNKPKDMPNLQIKLKKSFINDVLYIAEHNTTIVMKGLVLTPYEVLMRACFQNVSQRSSVLILTIRIYHYKKTMCFSSHHNLMKGLILNPSLRCATIKIHFKVFNI
jgi:hypothetical protein